jgi:hypothetical protein
VSEQEGAAAEPGTSAQPPPLFVVEGEATAEEVAALVVALQGVAAAQAVAQAGPTSQRPRSEWSAHHRKVRQSYLAGPGGWRSSAMPR